MEVINKRRSVRQFSDKEITDEVFEKLLRAAMQAPTAKNQQAWKFLVIRNRDSLNKLSEVSNLFVNCKAAILIMVDQTKATALEMTPADTGACTQNILLECVELGLGACWIGTAGRENRIMKFKEVFNIPDHLYPSTAVVIGYPKDENANYFVDRYDPSKVYYEEIK